MLTNKDQMLYKRALYLALFTITYNFIEGIVSISFGYSDEAFTLFGFGLDSFVEVISGLGIWHMISRIRRGDAGSLDAFETRALRTTGVAFFLLAIGLAVTAIATTLTGHQPTTTLWGIAVSAVSIASMWLLMYLKAKVGRDLRSAAILADAACTKTCLYLSFVLLVASISYEMTGIGYIDSVGSFVIAWFSWREGREAFEKAAGKSCSCCSCD